MAGMTTLNRGMVIDVNLDPTLGSKKAKITTNVEINPNRSNGLKKKSVADCLQTRPIDRRHRLTGIRGKLSPSEMKEIDQSLKIVFELS
jgi:mRNA interferase MazF